jgi:thymidine kinase
MDGVQFVLLRGPMFSGKSTEMKRRVTCERSVCDSEDSCIIFKYKKDVRYGSSEDSLITHAQDSVAAIAVGSAEEITFILCQHLANLVEDANTSTIASPGPEPTLLRAARQARDRLRCYLEPTLLSLAPEDNDGDEGWLASHSEAELKKAFVELISLTMTQPIAGSRPPKLVSHKRLSEYGLRMVGIDEGQFLVGLQKVVRWLIEEHAVHVVVAALDLDFMGRPFEETLALQAYPPEEDIKMKARCKDCHGHDGIHSFFLHYAKKPGALPPPPSHTLPTTDVPEGLRASTFRIGGADLYKPLCRFCYRAACAKAEAEAAKQEPGAETKQ